MDLPAQPAGASAVARPRTWWRHLLEALFGRGDLGWSPIPAAFALIAVGVFGVIPIVIYSSAVGGSAGSSVLSLSILLGLASLLVGGLVGFLFGVPRRLQGNDPANVGYAGNTNLEQISDWLTKILIGVGLTQILQIPGQLERLAAFLAPALGNQSSSQAYALALLAYFTVAGFLIGYMSTRLLVTRAFEMADDIGQAPKGNT
jgi:hypothetical protein